MDSIGKYLQETREALGLTIEDVTRATKLKTYIIEQIERDDFQAIGDVGFIKIMIITYSRFLQADTTSVQGKLVQLFDKPMDPPIKIDTVKNQKTVFIRPNTIYFILLGMLIVFLTFYIIKLYNDKTFSFNVLKARLANTETIPKPVVDHVEIEPDSLWLLQRQVFQRSEQQEDKELTETISDRFWSFSRYLKKKEEVPVIYHARKYLNDDVDYVGEFIFNNKVSPLNPDISYER